MKIKSKKKVGLIIGAVVLAAAAGGAFWYFRGNGNSGGKGESSAVYVDSVATICGLESTGVVERFAGTVEPQKTININADAERTIEEVHVKAGDQVKVGDKLFTYSVVETQNSLTEAEIALERLASDIETGNANVKELQAERTKAAAEDQLDYTVRIQTAQNDVKRNEYSYKSKQAEIENLKKTITNATVTSEIDGVVKSINSTDSGEASMGGDSNSYMTILTNGDYRIKGTVNEQNRSSVVEGQPVIVHSRVDETQTWTGTLTSVDTDNPESNSNDFYSSSDSGNSSTNYPFYVNLDSVDGLMLGQHVYIEMDYGQGEQKEGIWLGSYYIMDVDTEPYVWAVSDRDKIEKRNLTLGEYDEDMDTYQVLDGLTEDDFIAFPDTGVEEGMDTTKNIDQAADFNNDDDMMEEYTDMEDLGSGEEFEEMPEDGMDEPGPGDEPADVIEETEEQT